MNPAMIAGWWAVCGDGPTVMPPPADFPPAPTNGSLVDGNFANIETGPCSVSLGGILLGHTQGGVTLELKPSLRKRIVDEFGESTIDKVHQGDELTVKFRLAESSMQVLQTVHAYGLAGDGEVSIGRRPGVKGSSVAGQLIVHPLSAGDSTDLDLVLYNAAVAGSGDNTLGTVQSDRTWEVTFEAMVYLQNADGNLLGAIGVAG